MASSSSGMQNEKYYVPSPSLWPVQLTVGMVCTLAGASLWLEGFDAGHYVLGVGLCIAIFTIFLWFRGVIKEHGTRVYNDQVDHTFRLAMLFFIMSEVFFFGAFFGALFYTHVLTIPWLSGEGS